MASTVYNTQQLDGLKDYINALLEDPELISTTNDTLINTFIRNGLDEMAFNGDPQFLKNRTTFNLVFVGLIAPLPANYFYNMRPLPQEATIGTILVTMTYAEEVGGLLFANATYNPMYTIQGTNVQISHTVANFDLEYYKRPEMLEDSVNKNDFAPHLYDSLADFVIGRLLSQEQSTDEEKARALQFFIKFYKVIGAPRVEEKSEQQVARS